MKNMFRYLLLAGMVSVLALLTGCKEDPVQPTLSEFETLADYVVQQQLDLPDLIGSPWVKAASGLNVNTTDYSVPDYYVIDLRAQADYDKGHIKDAHIATLPTILEEAAKAGGKKILVVCYTGQNSARGVAALRLMGYDATSLKWGMAAWNTQFASRWDSKVADFTSPNWVSNATPATPGAFATPTISTGATDGAKILESRVRAMLANSTWSVSRDDVLNTPENYFINNKWPLVSWNTFGSIKGAYRLDEDMKASTLNMLDNSKTIVTYCYTGQTSSITTAWLEVMGYTNAKSLSFGANAIIYSKMLPSTVDKANTKSWKGEGAGSVNNFGYYDSTGTMH